jgi:ribosome biogenesis GTPase
LTGSAPDALVELGWNDRWRALAADAPDGSEPVRVVRHDGVAVVVAGADGVTTRPIRPALPPLAVGDWLIVDDEAILDVLPRTSLLQRRDPTRGGAQPIAANVDRVGIVCGLDRPVKSGRIQRFVVQVYDAGALPMVALTKADLADDTTITDAEALVERAAPGVDTLVCSVRTEHGLDALRHFVTGSTVAFVGESGAGKSTLVNALAGREFAATNTVRKGDSKGRHTTTARELHVLPGHCCLVDTPGLREIGLFTDVETVDDVFDDVADLADGCRFNDCTHTNEPGCAVLAAIADDSLDRERYESWQDLRKEAEAAELRADPAARRAAERKFGRLVREAQRLKRPDA